jgi:hypothetical protein
MSSFGRRIEFDPASRAFPIRTLIGEKPLRSYTWRCDVQLDQGPYGACVGFSWAAELAARPKVVADIGYDDGMRIYRRAQLLDPWPETPPEEGSSVLAGAKVVREEGKILEYRWAFGLWEALLAIGWHGPTVFGIPWRAGMMHPDGDGMIRAIGPIEGHHAILVNGISVRRELVRMHNSWGAEWGLNGDAFISFDDLGQLLEDDGECCVPVLRVR